VLRRLYIKYLIWNLNWHLNRAWFINEELEKMKPQDFPTYNDRPY